MAQRYDLRIEQRFTDSPLTADQVDKREEVRRLALEFATRLSELCPSSPELTQAVNHVDVATMLANASLARH